MLIRISPDGKEVVHIHNDTYNKITSEHADITINRASDVFFDNQEQKWRVKIRHTKSLLAITFDTRQDALNFEGKLLENYLRCGFI
jgi:hypothetical protein